MFTLCLENYLPPLIWARLRIFDHVFHDLAKKTLAKTSSDMLVTDTSFIKNIHGRRDQVLGRNRTDRGRMATNLSLLCNSEGLPLHYVLHCGNKADAGLLRHLLGDADVGAYPSYRRIGPKLQRRRLISFHACLTLVPGADAAAST